MIRKWNALVVILVISAPAAGQSKDQQIADAVLPLPDALRAGAKVVANEPQARYSVLREGTNDWICTADEPTEGFKVSCHHKNLFPLIQRRRQLLAQGMDRYEIRSAVKAEMNSGKLKIPPSLMAFELIGERREAALSLATVWIPFATAETTGLLTEPDSHRPWLMYAGSAFSHIMFPGK